MKGIRDKKLLALGIAGILVFCGIAAYAADQILYLKLNELQFYGTWTPAVQQGEPAPPVVAIPTSVPEMATLDPGQATAAPISPPADQAPEPMRFSDMGNGLVRIDKGNYAAIVHISGNNCRRGFSVNSYGANNVFYNVLVNTTDSYDGYRPLDFYANENTVLLEVSSNCAWVIEVFSLEQAERVNAPTTYNGTGDYVFLLTGQASTAAVTGNQGGHIFGVRTWSSSGTELIIHTTEPFAGTVSIPANTLVIEVTAVGPWSMTFNE